MRCHHRRRSRGPVGLARVALTVAASRFAVRSGAIGCDRGPVQEIKILVVPAAANARPASLEGVRGSSSRCTTKRWDEPEAADLARVTEPWANRSSAGAHSRRRSGSASGSGTSVENPSRSNLPNATRASQWDPRLGQPATPPSYVLHHASPQFSGPGYEPQDPSRVTIAGRASWAERARSAYSGPPRVTWVNSVRLRLGHGITPRKLFSWGNCFIWELLACLRPTPALTMLALQVGPARHFDHSAVSLISDQALRRRFLAGDRGVALSDRTLERAHTQ